MKPNTASATCIGVAHCLDRWKELVWEGGASGSCCALDPVPALSFPSLTKRPLRSGVGLLCLRRSALSVQNSWKGSKGVGLGPVASHTGPMAEPRVRGKTCRPEGSEDSPCALALKVLWHSQAPLYSSSLTCCLTPSSVRVLFSH
uniref:Uncharacterized protein n=1 Tax=Myotis myotis TaxID=51298 RepID=A0A7J7XZT5_MYOMY|nr:hypothetical protein mMyoMyo1_011451 [Myotis myotis]